VLSLAGEGFSEYHRHADGTEDAWKLSRTLPWAQRQEAGVRLRRTGETELPSPELSGWSGDAVFV
jgi:hypothetical protein